MLESRSKLSSDISSNMTSFPIIIFFFLIFTAFEMLSLGVDYCKLCKKGAHTLCRYKEGPSDSCNEYKKPEFTLSVKKYIVDIHNDVRDHVASGQEVRGVLGGQPAAANMNCLQWDNELAEIAQRWADQCIGLEEEFQHDNCRKTSRFEVGQNVLTAVTRSLEVPEIAILILNWYKQVENVLPSDIETFSGIQRGKFLIGQYTQMVWAETRFIGCGMSVFKNRNTTDPKAKYLHRLVCNYGPRGNVIGSGVYKRGTPCSKCPYGRCDSIRTSLCQATDEPDAYYMEKSFDQAVTKQTSLVTIPISMFDILSLGFMLKNNLTKVINNIIQKVDVFFGPDDLKYVTKDKLSMRQILALLSSITPGLNASQLEQLFLRARYVKENDLWENALKKPSNTLYQNRRFTKILNGSVFDLEEGRILIGNCSHQVQQCQYEDGEPLSKYHLQGDIMLPNGMTYRKVAGFWFHGRCRCDYVYRSGQTSGRSYNTNMLITLIFSILSKL